jgi:hypothetical protein
MDFRSWFRREFALAFPRVLFDAAVNGPVALARLPGSLAAAANKIPCGGTDGLLDVSWLAAKPGENLLVDGNFDFWVEGVSSTANGYGADTMWLNAHAGSSKVASRQAFAPGDTDAWDAPARYFSRAVVTSTAGAANLVCKGQKIEGVHHTAGRRLTLSLRGKADAARNIAVEAVQTFGSGGSAEVNGISAQIVALTTAWQKKTLIIDVPSIAGKTIGTSGADALHIYFYFDAGTNYAARSANLGQQSGSFDLAQVKLEFGGQATPFRALHPAAAAARVARYFQTSYPAGVVPGTAATWGGTLKFDVNTSDGGYAYAQSGFPSKMRAAPTVSLYHPQTGSLSKCGTRYAPSTEIAATAVDIADNGFNRISGGSYALSNVYQAHYVADARL